MASLAEVTTLSSAQIGFFAEDEHVTIIPSEALPELALLTGTVGPFEISDEVSVPLWLAAKLKKNGQCKIVPPSWLDVDHLEQVSNAQGKETQVSDALNLPYHWMEIATKVLDVAPDDVKQPRQVREILEHLWVKRSNAMRNNLIAVSKAHDLVYVDITNLHLGSMELNTVRPFFVETFSQLYTLHALKPERPGSTGASQYSGSSQSYPSRSRLPTGEPQPKQFRSNEYSQ